jgi:hypothetical protein
MDLLLPHWGLIAWSIICVVLIAIITYNLIKVVKKYLSK